MENNVVPTSIRINELKTQIVNLINNSGLPIYLIDMIIEGIHAEIKSVAEKQLINDYQTYNTQNSDESNKKENELPEA